MRAPAIAILVLVLISTSPASAAFKGCYQRLYSGDEIVENPNQTVDGIQVQLGQAGGGEEDEAMSGDINLDLKKGAANGVFALTKVSGNYCDKDNLIHR
jgi:hypothetical protein